MENNSQSLNSEDRQHLEDLQVPYEIPESVTQEVEVYLKRIAEHSLKREEFFRLTAEQQSKQAENPEYELARLRLLYTNFSELPLGVGTEMEMIERQCRARNMRT